LKYGFARGRLTIGQRIGNLCALFVLPSIMEGVDLWPLYLSLGRNARSPFSTVCGCANRLRRWWGHFVRAGGEFPARQRRSGERRVIESRGNAAAKVCNPHGRW